MMVLACGVWADKSFAQSNVEDPRGALLKQQGALKSAQEKAGALELDVNALRRERERLNAQLLETADRIQKSEEKMTSIEARLGELQEQEKIVRGSLEQRYGQIAQLLGSLQRMGRNPPPVMITRREDALAMVRSAMLLASAFPGLRAKAVALSNRLNELVRVLTDIRTEGDKLKAETQRLSDARVRLSGLMSEKKQSIAERQSELSQVRQSAAEISQKVNSLNELIGRLDEETRRNAKLAEYNARLAREQAAEDARKAAIREGEQSVAVLSPEAAPGQPVASGQTDGSSPPGDNVALRPRLPIESDPELLDKSSPQGETQVAILAPSPSAFGAAGAGRIEPAIPFHKAKGRLPAPTRGQRVLSFGEKTRYGGKSKGIVFQTRKSAQITSPCDGWVVYAGEFRSYGQLLIINAGGGYHVLLAGMSRMDVQPGQFVLAAEPVGTMSDAVTSVQREAGENSPVLYVEFRKDGQPIDPDPWWVAGLQKVQG